MKNIHATLVSYKNKGILLLGESGAGKSDVALRMIMEHQAILVADDRVDLFCKDGKLYGSAPTSLAGKLEIRGVGIENFDFKKSEHIVLCVELCSNRDDISRLPLEETIDFLGVSITKIKLYPFDCSIICKIIAKINHLC